MKCDVQRYLFSRLLISARRSAPNCLSLVEVSGNTELDRRVLSACVFEQFMDRSSTFEALNREIHVFAYANLA